jgi:hypothetical protein
MKRKKPFKEQQLENRFDCGSKQLEQRFKSAYMAA